MKIVEVTLASGDTAGPFLVDCVDRSIHEKGRLLLWRNGRCVTSYEPGEWRQYRERDEGVAVLDDKVIIDGT